MSHRDPCRRIIVAALLAALPVGACALSLGVRSEGDVDLGGVGTRTFTQAPEPVRAALVAAMRALGYTVLRESAEEILAEVPKDKIPGVFLEITPTARKSYQLRARLDGPIDGTRVRLSFFSKKKGLLMASGQESNLAQDHARMLYRAFWEETDRHLAGALPRRAETGGDDEAPAPPSRSLDELVAALGSPDIRERASAADELGRSRDPAAADPLMRLLEAPEALIRAVAVRSLGRLASSRARPAVERLLRRERDDRVRKAAEDALGQLRVAEGEGDLLPPF